MTDSFTVKKVVSIGCNCGGELRALQMVRASDERLFVAGTCENCKKVIPAEVDELIASLYSGNLVRCKSTKVN